MIDINITIEGLDQLKKAFDNAPELVVSNLEKAVESSAVLLQNQAVREAPTNKGQGGGSRGSGGNLKQRIRTFKINRLRSEVIPKVSYAAYVHEGTPPHVIRPLVKQALANKRSGQFFGKVVHHPGTRPNPFLLRAFNKEKSDMTAVFKKAIEDIFAQIKKGMI